MSANRMMDDAGDFVAKASGLTVAYEAEDCMFFCVECANMPENKATIIDYRVVDELADNPLEVYCMQCEKKIK